ncbi:hypothetical protein ACIQUL_29430 [Streptomyces sp. NPDC090303]|uniref:hypothetical protein n=1 Tax=Streptomyces sp. NPDC090303 TaxID=3365960 RepID=UPI003804161A
MTNTSTPQPGGTDQAPVGCVGLQCVDRRAFDEDGNPHEIHACHACLPWHAEVVLVDGETRVREWHAVGCPRLLELVGAQAGSCSDPGPARRREPRQR